MGVKKTPVKEIEIPRLVTPEEVVEEEVTPEELEVLEKGGVLITTLNKAVNWARKWSIWPVEA